MAVATWEDVATALGRPSADFTPDQQAQITYWLSGVEMLIKARLGDPALLDQEVLAYVETEAVAQKVRRSSEGGASSVTVSVDDGSVTRRYEGSVTAGDIAAEWWSMLSPRRGSFFTVRLSSPLDDDEVVLP